MDYICRYIGDALDGDARRCAREWHRGATAGVIRARRHNSHKAVTL